MVDICPFKAQERMNDVCKNNYFSAQLQISVAYFCSIGLYFLV